MAPKTQPNDEPQKPDTVTPPPDATKASVAPDGHSAGHAVVPEVGSNPAS